jgi:exodeoxyribonuclease VII small subunit
VAKKKATKSTETSFEKSLQELETIVGKLEGGKLGLAESLQEYEAGVKHLKACYRLLSEAERRIALVSGLDASGRPRTAPLDASEDESLEAKTSARSRRRSAPGEVDDGSTLF